MEILYCDRDIIVCLKEPGILSTDEPGGMPDKLREALGKPDAVVKTVHRLDRVVGGLMVFAANKRAASKLSADVRENRFEKRYRAVVHGHPEADLGELRDILDRNPVERKTFVTDSLGKTAREAILNYRVLSETDALSMVEIELVTGRTHQIRAQFSSRGLPLWGDRKYGPEGLPGDEGTIALWSCRLRFTHPYTGEVMEFHAEPPDVAPWNLFRADKGELPQVDNSLVN